MTINILVFGSPVATATATEGTNGPGPTVTPTVVPVIDVARLVVQANPFVIKSALGGDITITVLAFDENNLGVAGIRLPLDAEPRAGYSFDPITPITNSAASPPPLCTWIRARRSVRSSLPPSPAAWSAGSITIQVVSGVSERPVATIVLESDQPVIGTDSGGTASLKARVFDADNIGIPDVNVLFATEIGQVTPPVEISCGNS